MVFTRNQLKDMNKEELVDNFLKLQTTADTSIQELSTIIKELKSSFENKIDALTKEFERRLEIIESDLKISHNTSFLLEKRVISLEQYSRRECLEIRGVPITVEQDKLVKFLKPIFKKLDVDIKYDNEIQACHRLNNKEDVIIKFSNRYQRNGILTSRKKLKDFDAAELGLPENAEIFINESLSPYNRRLTGIASRLKRRGDLFSFWTINGNIRFKFREHDNQVISITHERDFYEHFPNTNFDRIFDR